MILLWVLLAVVVTFAALMAHGMYKLGRRNAKYGKDYWKKAGIKEPKGDSLTPVAYFFRGSIDDAINASLKHGEEMRGEKYYGTFSIDGRPTLMINDAELAKVALVKEFNKLTDRQSTNTFAHLINKNMLVDRLWSKSMFMTGGTEWKDVRSTFTPVFSTGSLRNMGRLIAEVSRTRLSKTMETAALSGEELDLKAAFGSFSMDVLASCAFGIDVKACGAAPGTETEYERQAKRFLRMSATDKAKFFLGQVPGFPWLLNLFGVSVVFKTRMTLFFHRAIVDALQHRRESKVRRNDLIDLMIDAMEDKLQEDTSGEPLDQYEADSKLEHTRTRKKKDADVEAMVSTALGLLAAGYDTTAAVMSILGYTLAMYPDIQARMQEEVDAAVERHGDAVTSYAVVQELEYLDMAISEILRLNLVMPLQRSCVEDLEMPGGVRVPKGTDVHISLAGIHLDPEVYPDPMELIPERFSKEEKAKRSPYSFMPFGQGPRNCIAMRFAMFELKIGLVEVLRKYSFVKSKRTPMTDDGKAKILSFPQYPVYVGIEKR